MNHWKIKDLKGVGDVELELDDSKRVFVLFGSNGVGKTKTLEALFLFFLEKNYSAIYNQLETPYDTNIGNNDINLIDFNKIDYRDIFLNFSKPKSEENINGVIVFLPTKNRLYTKNKTNNNSTTLENINQIGITSYKFSHSDDYLAYFSNYHKQEDIHLWFIEKAKSVNPYQKSGNNYKSSIDAVLEALHTIDDRFDKNLSIDDDNVYLSINGKDVELRELSSGFISVVKIIQSIISSYSAFTNATDLLNVKGVVLIDEIESHLHVEWQTKIIPTLKNLFPNTTFYIATHSPLVLSQLEEGEAYLLKRDEDDVVRSEVIRSPNKRIFSSVLEDAFGIDLNQLKRDSMEHSDQSKAKSKLLALLNDKHNKEGYFSE